MSSVSTVSAFFHRPPFLPASGAFTKSLHVCICFQTCFAAYKHTRISAKAQLFLHLPKGFLKGRTVQYKYVALFLLFFIFKMKSRSRGTAYIDQSFLVAGSPGTLSIHRVPSKDCSEADPCLYWVYGKV